jgi:hypothetical protein
VKEFDPLAVDRELKQLAERWLAFRRQLARGEQPRLDPYQLSRWVCGRGTYDQLRSMALDPVAPALARWVYRFTEQRVNSELFMTISERRKRDTHALEEPERGRFSIHQMLLSALEKPVTRHAWLIAALRHSQPTHESIALLWEQRQELAVRMSLSSPDEIQAPCSDPYDLAEQWLKRTEDVWQTAPELRLDGLLEQALATKAELEWPARITPRALLDFFSDSQLMQDLSLDPGKLPATIAPASWARALARLGSAFVDASAPRDQPFAIRHDPYGLERRRTGALFALLLVNREFLRRRLGASRSTSERARRALCVCFLIESRLAALRVLMRRAAHQGGRALRECFDAESQRAIRVSLPGHAAGVLVRLHDDDLQRFCGLFLGALRAHQLLTTHDEDWFRNPRAVDQLRSEAGLPPHPNTDNEKLDAGSTLLLTELSTALQ